MPRRQSRLVDGNRCTIAISPGNGSSGDWVLAHTTIGRVEIDDPASHRVHRLPQDVADRNIMIHWVNLGRSIDCPTDNLQTRSF